LDHFILLLWTVLNGSNVWNLGRQRHGWKQRLGQALNTLTLAMAPKVLMVVFLAPPPAFAFALRQLPFER